MMLSVMLSTLQEHFNIKATCAAMESAWMTGLNEKQKQKNTGIQRCSIYIIIVLRRKEGVSITACSIQ